MYFVLVFNFCGIWLCISFYYSISVEFGYVFRFSIQLNWNLEFDLSICLSTIEDRLLRIFAKIFCFVVNF